MDEETRLLLQYITEYEKQIEPYRIQVGEAESKIDAYTEILLDNDIMPVSYGEVIISPELRSLRAEMSRAKLELAGYGSTGAQSGTVVSDRRNELYTRVIRLESEMTKLITDLVFSGQAAEGGSYIMVVSQELAKAYTLKFLAEVDINYLTQLRDKYEKQMETFPALEQRLLDLQRDVTVKQNLYILLLESFEEAKIAEAAVIGTTTLIDEAITPRSPIKPNKQMLLAVGVLLGLFLGVLLVFLIEAFDDAVRDEESIRRALGSDMPIIGRVPHIALDEEVQSSELVVYNDPTSPPSEAYKLISTNISYSDVESPQVVSVTSAEMSQGKTSVAANTGIAMAQNGFRTLIIDADMRKPRLEKAFGYLRSQKGMVNHLLQDQDLNTLIQKPIEDLPLLDLLPVGPVPPNPTAVLTSAKFRAMIDELRTRYDRIIIDLPPFLAASDALIVSRSGDGIVMVVRFGQASKYGLKIAEETLRTSGLKLVGVVLNDISREDSYSYYHYYYYYTDERSGRKKRGKHAKSAETKHRKKRAKFQASRKAVKAVPGRAKSTKEFQKEVLSGQKIMLPGRQEAESPVEAGAPGPVGGISPQHEEKKPILPEAKNSVSPKSGDSQEKDSAPAADKPAAGEPARKNKSPFDYISELEEDFLQEQKNRKSEDSPDES